jgi:uncharacterized repeat protein (TIGR04076 family)
VGRIQEEQPLNPARKGLKMASRLPNCKITVLKKVLHHDLIDEYLDDSHQDIGLCQCFEEGEEFVVDPSVMPEGFCARCAWAWADIRRDILTVAMGADMPGMRHTGTIIAGCTDWFRPVIFKI